MRRAEETGEVDGLYKTKRNLDKTQYPSLHGDFFFVYFAVIIENQLGVLGLYLEPVTCRLWCTVRRWLTPREREKVLGGLRCKNQGISGADK